MDHCLDPGIAPVHRGRHVGRDPELASTWGQQWFASWLTVRLDGLAQMAEYCMCIITDAQPFVFGGCKAEMRSGQRSVAAKYLCC